MNMISTGAFQSEMDASNKQTTLAEKFAAVWEKKNAKAARAGGVSLMALSLAACGSSDDDTTSTAAETTTTVSGSEKLTVGSDVLTASLFTAEKASHINSSDNLTGTSASTDKLALEDISGSTVAPTMSGVETVVISSNSSDAAVFSLANATGVTTVEVVNGTNGLDVAGIDNLSLSMSATGVAAGKTLELRFDTLTTQGAADTFAVTLNGNGASGSASTMIVGETNGASSAAIETLQLSTTGTKSFMDLDWDGKTLELSGDAGLSSTLQAGTSVVKVTGGSAPHDITVAAATATVTMGAGDERVVINDSVGDTVDFGDGKDTLALSATGNHTAVRGVFSNYEVVEMTGASSTTIDVDTVFTGTTEFVVSGGDTGAAGVYLIDDAASGAIVTITTIDPDATEDDDVNLTLATDGTADTATFYVGSATVAASLDEIIGQELETANIVLGAKDGGDVDNLTFATDATKLNVSGSGNYSLGSINMKAGTQTIDMSGAEGNLTYTLEAATTILTGSAGNDTVTLSSNGLDALDNIDLGAGTDSVSVPAVTTLGTTTRVAAETLTLTFGANTTADTSDFLSSTITTLAIDGAATSMSTDLTLNNLGVTNVRITDFADTASQDTLTLNYQAGTTSAVIEIDEYGAAAGSGDDENLTITGTSGALIRMKDLDKATTEGAFINTLNVNTLTDLTIDMAAKNGTGDIGGAIDITALTAAALTTLTLTSATDSTTGITIDTSTTDSSLTSIDGSGLNGSGSVILGSTSAVIDRAGTATITLGSGDDNLTFNMNTHGSNVINMGTNAALSTSNDGDLLIVSGTQTGNTVIDLLSSTDQITTLNGSANTATQTGVDSIDLSGLTVASGSVTITGTNAVTGGTSGANTFVGSGGVDVIHAGSGADTITGGDGLDVIDLGAADGAADTVLVTALTDGGSTGADSKGDTITNFVSTSDKIKLDGTAATAFDDITNNTALAFVTTGIIDGNTGAAVAATLTATNEMLFLDAANSNIVSGDLDDLSVVATKLEAQITLTATTGDDGLIVVESTTAGTFGVYSFVEASTTDNFDAADLAVLAIVTGDDVVAGDFITT